MARKPPPRPRAQPSSTTPTNGRDQTERDPIVIAFMALLAEKRIEHIGFAEIAARAGVSLAELRGRYDSTLAILAAQIKEIDRAVLSGGDADMAEEPPRERLFDVLMRRVEALSAHKEAVRSQQWMLTAADISASGPRGMIRAQGLACLFAGVLRTFVDDEDPSHARTMAALDRALARGQRWSGLLDDVCRLPACIGGQRRRRDRADEPSAAA